MTRILKISSKLTSDKPLVHVGQIIQELFWKHSKSIVVEMILYMQINLASVHVVVRHYSVWGL
jgi:hypothetical protein